MPPTRATRASSLKLGGELASAHAEDGLLLAGGGAPLAVCLHRARAADLGGLEFVCAIPGTVGGGVKMNAGAYGGDIASILVRAQVADADGAEWRSPEELGLSYRRSALEPGQVVAAAEFQGVTRPEAEIKEIVAGMQKQRKDAQPTNKRTFGSVFKNPEHELTAGRMLEACGLRGFRIGGAQISPKHANFIENAGEAQVRGRRGADRRSAAAGPRAVRRHARARGATPRRDRDPARRVGRHAAAPNCRVWPGNRLLHSRARAAFPRSAGPRRRAVLIGACVVALLGLLYLGARETPVFALRTVEVEGAPANVRQAILQSLEETRGTSLVSLDGDAVVRRLEALPSVQSVTYDRAFPHTLRLVVVPEKPVAVVNQASNLWIVSVRGRVIGGTSAAEAPDLPRIRYLARRAARRRPVRRRRGDEDRSSPHFPRRRSACRSRSTRRVSKTAS